MAADDDDFALTMFDCIEAKQSARLQQRAEDDERWWIVMAAKVAVRAATNTDGKPMNVLPATSVVRAQLVERVGPVRWIKLHDDELPFFAKRSADARSAASAVASEPAVGEQEAGEEAEETAGLRVGGGGAAP